MTDLPEPLTTPEIDVRDLAGFMLNSERLMSSELWALSNGDAFKAAVALWCRAWKQVPAGSLPKDDTTLAAFSGAGPKWRKLKDMALRGFIECSDGRLYNKTLCEDANRAYRKKIERRERTRAATEARKKERNDGRGDARDGERNVDVTTSHRRDETRRDDSKNPPPLSARENLDHLEHELRRAAGAENNPSPSLMVVAPILGLIDQGADLENEILPAIAAKPKPDARSWDYFVPQIQEFRARRRRAADAPLPNGTGPPAKRNLAIAHFEERAATYDKSADEPYVPNASRA